MQTRRQTRRKTRRKLITKINTRKGGKARLTRKQRIINNFKKYKNLYLPASAVAIALGTNAIYQNCVSKRHKPIFDVNESSIRLINGSYDNELGVRDFSQNSYTYPILEKKPKKEPPQEQKMQRMGYTDLGWATLGAPDSPRDRHQESFGVDESPRNSGIVRVDEPWWMKNQLFDGSTIPGIADHSGMNW